MEREQDHKEQEEAEIRSSPSGQIIYKAIVKEANEELNRPSSALFWSGFAAGLSMGASLVAEGLLNRYLPESTWRPLISKLGYSVGFLMVILGRQQLFTENTLTPVLPLLRHRTMEQFVQVMRLWAVVLLANLLGSLAVAWVSGHSNAFDSEARRAFLSIGLEAMKENFSTILIRGVFAGWLIALMVWLLPFAESARIWIIIIISYLVGIGHFSHVVAGAVQTFYVAALSQVSWGKVFAGYLLPTLIGNILGGVALVAAISHAQVVAGKKEN